MSAAAKQFRLDLKVVFGEEPPSMAPEFEPDLFTPALERLHNSLNPGVRIIANSVYGYPGCNWQQHERAVDIFGFMCVMTHGIDPW